MDTYTASQKALSTVYPISGLSPGAHTLLIVVTGTHDAASTAS